MAFKDTNSSLRVADLISGYQAGTLRTEEEAELDSQLAADPLLKQSFDAVTDKAVLRTDLELMNSFDPEQTIADFHKQYYPESKAVKVTRLWSRIGIAAAVATIIISAGIWFLKNPSKENSVQQSAYQNDVAPGKQGATLTLANGKKIRLTDAANGELAKEAGVVITKSASGQLIYEIASTPSSRTKGRDLSSPGTLVMTNVLTTDNGETYQVRLPDGSYVWLNAASTLKYPASFAKLKDRRVELSGEGYFEVAKDKAHPFIVESKGQKVEVLGTHFNISAYQDEKEIKTTLMEGSVRVRHAEFISASRTSGAALQGRDPDLRQDDVVLKPNQQAILLNNKLDVITANIDQVTAWKNGKFAFQKESLQNIMRGVARWYNVEVVFEPGFQSKPFTGSMSRFENISTVLHVLELTGTVHFKVEGRRITVMK